MIQFQGDQGGLEMINPCLNYHKSTVRGANGVDFSVKIGLYAWMRLRWLPESRNGKLFGFSIGKDLMINK